MNPYWDLLAGPDSPLKGYLGWARRHELCAEYSWAIPDPDSIAFVLEHAGKSIVEMGAGTGYWAWQLAQLGADVIAYDRDPPQISGRNNYHSPKDDVYGEPTGKLRTVFFDVRKGTAVKLKAHSDRALFLSWPPMSAMAFDSLKAYKGRRLVYIGESYGGCTASDDFFALINKEWTLIASHKVVQWFGIHDYVMVYDRK